MKFQLRPFFGALALAIFITGCLALMIHNLGKSLEMWILVLVLAVWTIAIYEVAVKLLGDMGPFNSPVSNSHDELSES